MRADVYQKITDQIVRDLEQGVRPWMKPWSAGHGEGRIMRPLRANGIPYRPWWVRALPPQRRPGRPACVLPRPAAGTTLWLLNGVGILAAFDVLAAHPLRTSALRLEQSRR
jgi:hypothetical protein